MQKYPSGSRGSPAKGVVWDNRSAGSNPAFCANSPKSLFFKGSTHKNRLFYYLN